MRTDIYSRRFALGHALPEGANPIAELVRQINSGVPSGIWAGNLTGPADKQTDTKRFYDPLAMWSYNTDVPYVARRMIDMENWLGVEITASARNVYGWWAFAMMPNMFAKHEDLIFAALRDHVCWQKYLNLGDSQFKGNLNAAIDENFAREMMERAMWGDAFYVNDREMLREFARACAGLWNGAMISTAQWPGDRIINGVAFPATPGSLEQWNSIVRYMSRHPATAAEQSRRIMSPIFGERADVVLPRVHAAMVAKWLETDGDRKQVEIVMVSHPDSWTQEYVSFQGNIIDLHDSMNRTGTPYTGERKVMVKDWWGIEPHRAIDPQGFLYDTNLGGGPALAKRLKWPLTEEQRFEALSHRRVLA